MNMNFALKDILFFIIVTTLAYLLYKRRTFIGISWMRGIFQSVLFIVGSVVLLFQNKEFVVVRFTPISLYIGTFMTLVWFVSPWYVRRFGKKPVAYIREHPFQFIVRFEYRVMLMKYFEILFQQAQLLYVMFVLFGSIQNTSYKLLLFFGFVILVHYVNIYLMPDRKAAIFWLKASIPMGILFGPLLLSGHVLITTSIHILAYLFFVSYWMPNLKQWRLL